MFPVSAAWRPSPYTAAPSLSVTGYAKKTARAQAALLLCRLHAGRVKRTLPASHASLPEAVCNITEPS